MANTRWPISVGSRCSTRSARRSSLKQAASRSTSPIALSAPPSNSAPASDVTLPASNAATILRPSAVPKSKLSGVHSVGIEATYQLDLSICEQALLPLQRLDAHAPREISGLPPPPMPTLDAIYA